jgi:uncharacterized protein (DUF433 family)
VGNIHPDFFQQISRSIGITEADLLYDYPTISAADLKNAWAYAEAFPEEIEIAIRKNEED